ncbi:MAG: hypothetical protein RLO52_42515 [Sandaracinaceae bacterium]
MWRSLGGLLALIALATGAPGCGPGIPARFVIERDIDGWSYRRYQRVLDVEIAMAGNAAVGHTATYVQRASRSGRGTSVPYANVFVSVYERPQGLAEEVRRQVRALGSYQASVRGLGGGHVWYLDAGPGDRWALWVSGAHVVKVGASDATDDVPEAVVSAYMGVFPSDLDEHGRARDGTASAGEPPGDSPTVSEEEAEFDGAAPSGGDDDEEVPHFLREDAPR